MEELTVKDGVVYTLQRGDTVVVTLGGPVSNQGRLLMQRQLNALFPQQKVVVLDHGMTFQVYSEQGDARKQAALTVRAVGADDPDEAAKVPARRKA